MEPRRDFLCGNHWDVSRGSGIRTQIGSETAMKEEEYRALIALALEARLRAYAPYSHYLVGAALRCADGTVFQGCNIENASYGASVCAERTALFAAAAQGKRDYAVLALVSGPEEKDAGKDPEGEAVKMQPRESFGSGEEKMQPREAEAGRGDALLPWPSPCGICRQVLREFVNPSAFRIVLARSVSVYRVVTLEEFLPESFGPDYL